MSRKGRKWLLVTAPIAVVCAAACFVFFGQVENRTSRVQKELPIDNEASSTQTNQSIKFFSDNKGELSGVDVSSAPRSVPASNQVDAAAGQQSATEVALERIDQLLADDDLVSAYELTKSLMNHPDAEVRMEVAEIFGWIGLRALTELSLMLSDKDSDVASVALHNWELTIDDITDEKLKASVIVEGIKLLKNQEDVDSLLLNFDSMEEAIGVRSLVAIIQNGSPIASELAREHYEFLTDEPYTTPDAAENWVKSQYAE